jgi:hypothetical protein
MVSQIVFGETFAILETRDDWHLISLDFDNYMGWVGINRVERLNAGDGADPVTHRPYRMVFLPCVTARDVKLDRPVFLPAGSILPGTDGNTIYVSGREYTLPSDTGILVPGPDVDPERVGNGLFSIPYLWGGRCGFGFDCSGLTQTLCRMLGTSIPRDAIQQAALGETVHLIHETRKGDLAFFEDRKGEISHVGMMLGGGRILHAYANVRIDRIDQQGIYDPTKRTYTHILRVIKRMAQPKQKES